MVRRWWILIRFKRPHLCLSIFHLFAVLSWPDLLVWFWVHFLSGVWWFDFWSFVSSGDLSIGIEISWVWSLRLGCRRSGDYLSLLLVPFVCVILLDILSASVGWIPESLFYIHGEGWGRYFSFSSLVEDVMDPFFSRHWEISFLMFGFCFGFISYCIALCLRRCSFLRFRGVCNFFRASAPFFWDICTKLISSSRMYWCTVMI